jgi:hypothetical protein
MFKRLFARKASQPERPNEPAGPALERARRIAFVAPNADSAKGLHWPDAARKRGASVDVLPTANPFKDAEGRISSFVYTPPQPGYDCIVLARQIDLFEHSWSYAFLDRLNGLLAATGALIVPRCIDPARQIQDARLAQLFGSVPQPAGKLYHAFAKAPAGLARPAEAALSTLDAYWPLMHALLEHDFDPRLGDVIRALGVARPRNRVEPPVDLMAALQSQSYRTTSARTKAAMMQHVIAQCLPGRQDLHLVDVGAGTGLNSLEMLLNPAGVSSLTLVETRHHYHWAIAAMVEQLGERVRGRVRLTGDPGQSFAARPADVAMVCGVFSILPRGAREDFAANTWSNVAPGGILAVLENMRTGGGARFDEQRYAPDEIDATLGRFGPIRYFAGDAMKELQQGEVGEQSVFRVVRKPA